jgi:hypothetical protein
MEVEVSAGGRFDTVLAVYTGSRGSLTEITCNDDRDDLQAFVVFDAVAGETYFIQAGSFDGNAGGLLGLRVALFSGEFPFSDPTIKEKP